jgi:hypothetical protein
MSRGIKADTQDLRTKTGAIKQDTSEILALITRLEKLQSRESNDSTGGMLQRYIDELFTYAESAFGGADQNEAGDWDLPEPIHRNTIDEESAVESEQGPSTVPFAPFEVQRHGSPSTANWLAQLLLSLLG